MKRYISKDIIQNDGIIKGFGVLDIEDTTKALPYNGSHVSGFGRSGVRNLTHFS